MTLAVGTLRTVEPRQVVAWLRVNGWELVDTRPEHTASYQKPSVSEGDFVVEVPLNTEFRDYTRRMFEVIETLVIASGKPLEWVLAEVGASTSDIIRLRVTGPAIGAGRVPVDLGAHLFANTRELLLAAACAAHDLRPAYRTRKPTEAVDFLRRVKFSAPEAGSFIVTVHAPVPPALPQLSLVKAEDDAADAPFERRSTLMLATATASAREAAEQVGLGGDAAAFRDATARGLSANLCDALAGFVDGEGTVGLDVMFAWAGSRAVPVGTPTAVHIGSDLSPILREAGRLLRASSPTPDFELEGAVVRLESADPSQGGHVVIAGLVDGRQRKVRVQMDANDYTRALQAHESAQLLRCEGELSRKGRQLELERVRHLELITEDD